MYDKFAQSTKQLLAGAKSDAQNTGSDFVTAGHLMKRILEDTDVETVAAVKSLCNYMGLSVDKLKEIIDEQLTENGNNYSGGTAPNFSTECKKAIEWSFDEARNSASMEIKTVHLLFGVLRVESTEASSPFFNMDVENFRKSYDDSLSPVTSSGGIQDEDGELLIDKMCVDFTQLARDDKLDPVIGRGLEIERVVQILAKRTKNNPVLIGEPGVGKTAIVEGLARKIVSTDVPEVLLGKRVLGLDLALLVAGTMFRGEFEMRIKRIVDEIKAANGEIILFIDELHTLIGAGGPSGGLDAANILKPALARGELRCVGATTLDEYRRYIERSGALARRFQPVMVDEPSVPEAIEILQGLKERYSDYHKVEITDEAIESAAKLSNRFISDRFLPDKAIDLMDEAAARMKTQAKINPDGVTELEAELKRVKSDKQIAVGDQKFEEAAELRKRELEIEDEIKNKKEEFYNSDEYVKQVITDDEIAEILYMWTKIPAPRLKGNDNKKLREMEDEIKKRIVGQEHAINTVCSAVRRFKVGLKEENRPLGCFFFAGPTGVGKTELSKTLAEYLFGDEKSLIRFDMSEYMHSFNVSRLIGSPPGYVGHEDGGQLTEAVRKNPYSVVLFDEIEKAHWDVFNIFLQILDDGILTDSQGRKINFKNTILIMTSNVGTELIDPAEMLGFNRGKSLADCDLEKEYEHMKQNVMKRMKKTFRPEFLNRMDEFVIFKMLEKQQVEQIVRLLIARLAKRTAAMNLNLHVTDDVVSWLAERSYEPQNGARPARRMIQKHIEEPISNKIVSYDEEIAGDVYMSLKDDKVVADIKVVEKKKETEPTV